MFPLITVLIPWLVSPAPPPKVSESRGGSEIRPHGPTEAPVVKVHGFGCPAASALPARSFAAFVIVAVYCVLAARFAVGVKVAMLFVESYVTFPATAAPPTPIPPP